ncbi:MAG: DUF481 domain-containing protein [Bdellovibrionota bacterium]
MKLICCLLALISSSAAHADWSTDAEAGIVSTTGNSRSQSYSAKDKTTYKYDADSYVFNGSYLQSQANGTQNAQNWLVGLRYERALSEKFSLFLAQDVQGDKFAGILQRYDSDLGGKYYFVKKEKDLIAFSEAGYRYTNEHTVTGTTTGYQKARVYAEGEKYWSPTVSSKLSVEYIPNFTVSQNWLFNTEASLSAALNSTFSLKAAYLVRYNNAPPVITAVKGDTTLTTALAAKF